MKVKITNASSEHGKDFIGLQGKLIMDYQEDGKMHIQKDDDERYLNTSRIEKMTVQTRNTTYELEVVDD